MCRVRFYEDSFQDETLHVYYMLDNFYQNNRHYVKSIDHYQLLGLRNKDDEELSSECEPFRYKIDPETNIRYKYAPCGVVANSLFNGMFKFRTV